MTIILSEDKTFLYNNIGYGGFNISLTKGVNEVDDQLGSFINENFPSLVVVDRKSQIESSKMMIEKLKSQIESLSEGIQDEVIPEPAIEPDTNSDMQSMLDDSLSK